MQITWSCCASRLEAPQATIHPISGRRSMDTWVTVYTNGSRGDWLVLVPFPFLLSSKVKTGRSFHHRERLFHLCTTNTSQVLSRPYFDDDDRDETNIPGQDPISHCFEPHCFIATLTFLTRYLTHTSGFGLSLLCLLPFPETSLFPGFLYCPSTPSIGGPFTFPPPPL
jgi:hypothetical protein